MSYAPMERFTAPACPAVRPWIFVAGLFLAELTFDLMWFPVSGLLGDRGIEGTDPVALTVVLLSYALPVLMLGLWMRRMQGRRIGSLIGPAPRFREDLWAAAKGAAAVYTLMTLAFAFAPTEAASSEGGEMRAFASWLALLPVALVAILVQSGAEELIFRGYIMQELRARTSLRRVWLVVPAVLFGAVHYMNGDGPADGLFYAVWATGLGFACGDLVARTGSTGAAVGLHWVNNLFAMLFFGTEDTVDSGFALFVMPAGPETAVPPEGLSGFFSAASLLELAVALLWVGNLWLGVRVALRR